MRVSTRIVVRSLSIPIVTLACCAHTALADWGRVTITPTTTSIPLVEGCADGAGGSFIAWQEGSPAGVLRAQHLLSTGILDPSWPAAGAMVCDVAAARSELAMVPDRQGGAYVSWKENASLYVTRLDPGGAVAAGWPARGRSLGGVSSGSPRPVLIEDGQNGIYVAWAAPTTVVAIHIGPANTGAGGWPGNARTLSATDPKFNAIHWPQIALAPDGGLFAAWAMSTTDEEVAPSAWILRRLTPAGLNADGWPTGGMSFGSFRREFLGSSIRASLLALSPDGRGGVFLSIGNPTGNEPGAGAILESRLYRPQGSGESAADWPAGGVVASQAPYYYVESEFGPTPDYSYRVFPDAVDGALAGYPQFGLHGTSNVGFALCDEAGQFEPGYAAYATAAGNEVADDGLGGHFVANFHPTGPTGPYQPNAFLGVRHTNKAFDDWSEMQFECCVTFYGDIGLASTEDGGAVLFWSQSRDRIGLFAQQFNSSGAITAVEPAPGGVVGISLGRLRFVPGVGVRAALGLGSEAPARFELFDVAGRRIASQAVYPYAVSQRGSREESDQTLEGTADLRSGLYIGRLLQGGRSVAAKLIVTR